MALGGRDVLKLIVDGDSSGATREFDKLGRNIKSSLGDAETQAKGLSGVLGRAFDGLAAKSPMVAGIFDKLGVSGTQAGSAIASAIPAATVVAAGAVAAFAVSSVGKFQDVALAADKFRDSTGLSLEESSKWIAVADDVNISASTFQTAFQKMEKAIGTNRQAFGDLIATAKDGSTDLSGTFLTVITHLQNLKDPIERATEASKLFGKGFAEVSEIITTDAGTLKAALAGVSESQIINEAEVQKARDFQAAMDSLGDAFRDISIDVGGALVPALADAATALSGLVNLAHTVGDAFGGWVGTLATSIGNAILPIDGVRTALELINPSVTGVAEVGTSFDNLAGKLQAGKVDAGGWGASVAAAGGVAKQSFEEVSAAFALMQGNLSAEEAILGLQDSFARVGETAIEAWNKTASGEAGASQAVRNNEKAVIDLKQQVVSYGAEVLGLPPERVTALLALIDAGKLTEAETELNTAAADREAKMTAVPSSATAVADFDKAVAARIAQMKAQADTAVAVNSLDNAAKTRQANINALANTGVAEGSLNNTSRSRAASINASVNTGNAESVLSNLARTRTAVVNVIQHVTTSALFGIPKIAGGATNFGGGVALVGEKGPELVTLPRGADVYTASQTAGMLGSPSSLPMSGGGGSGRAFNITINGALDPIGVGRAVKQAIAAAERAGVN